MAVKVKIGTTQKQHFSIEQKQQIQRSNQSNVKTFAAIMPLAAGDNPYDTVEGWSTSEWTTFLSAYKASPDVARQQYGDEITNYATPSAAAGGLLMEAIQRENPGLSQDDYENLFNNQLKQITAPEEPSANPLFNSMVSSIELNEIVVTAPATIDNTDNSDYVEYVNEFGEAVYVPVDPEIQKKMDELYKELAENSENWSDEERAEWQEKYAALQKQAMKNAEEIYASGTGDEMNNYNDWSQSHLSSWDPRLQRSDAFFFKQTGESGNIKENSIIVPMSTITAATAFRDMVFVQNRHFASKLQQEFINRGWPGTDFPGADQDAIGGEYREPNTETAETTEEGDVVDFQTYHPGAIPVPFNTKKYYEDPAFYGTASLMNYYSLTKLCGGLGGVSIQGEDGVSVQENYMYDVRDQRRFYGLNVAYDKVSDESGDVAATSISATQTDHPLAVSIPSVSNIIKWSNSDKWGRTPYTYQDFVYSKWFGRIPNNRLLTLRRYHAPVLDNLQFDGMVKPDVAGPGYTETAAFAPRCTVVTYIGEDTGNKFSDLLKFSSGIAWKDVESKIWDVTGEEGDDPQATIDGMFDGGGGFGGAENNVINSFINRGSTVTGKFLSLTKFLGLAGGSIQTGMTQKAFDNLSKANTDPYSDGSYENRIMGPINRINKVKRRSEEITFDQSFSVKCTYTAKAIGGINPKAAMLDILANCMEMVSADAVFWGGGHRFNIQPKLYPYHDGGMRDNFMKKLFDGKLFGSGGAIDSVLSGLKSFAFDGNGDLWSNLQAKFSQFWGNAMGMVGSLLGSITGSLFGEGSGNALSNFFEGASDNKDAVAQGKGMMDNIGKNLTQMWRNKVIENTAVPQIKSMNSLLIGEPVGEWHLTIGNPLNPIAVIGNLICEKMDVDFSDELGPDDFPQEMTISYSLQHGMMRDKSAIQSMFNRGMGKIYELPDYIRSSSDFETHVDHYTGDRVAFRKPAYVNSAATYNSEIANTYGSGTKRFQGYAIDPGSELKTHGSPNTSLITKFIPINNSNASDIVGNSDKQGYGSNIPVIRALTITRKYTS